MTDDNDLVIDKTRCRHYARKVIPLPKAADFEPFSQWLLGEKRLEQISRAANAAAPAEHHSVVTAGSTPADRATPPGVPAAVQALWRDMRDMRGIVAVFD